MVPCSLNDIYTVYTLITQIGQPDIARCSSRETIVGAAETVLWQMPQLAHFLSPLEQGTKKTLTLLLSAPSGVTLSSNVATVSQ